MRTPLSSRPLVGPAETPTSTFDRKDAGSDHLLLVRTAEDGTEEDVGTVRWYISALLQPFSHFSPPFLLFPSHPALSPASPAPLAIRSDFLTVPLPSPPLRRYSPLSKLGRFAVLKPYRGTGAGGILGGALEEHIRERRGGAKKQFEGKDEGEIVANSQMIALGYYLKKGWKTEGEEFLEVRRAFSTTWDGESGR